MLINSNYKNKKGGIIIGSILILLSLILLKLVFLSDSDTTNSDSKSNMAPQSLRVPTSINSNLYTEDLLMHGKNKIYEKDNLSLFLNNELGTPTLMAVYSDSISPLEKDGRFLVFIYLKDPTVWEKINKINSRILLKKESLTPIIKEIDNRTRYIFKFRLEHPYFDINNLKELEFVRHTRELGRFEEVKFSPNEHDFIYPVTNTLKKLRISLNSDRLEKLTRKRNGALKSGFLVTNDDDFVKAKINLNGGENLSAQIRLKGDLTDHLEHPTKWSYRIVTDGEKTLMGMRKFSVQHPKSRNYLWEWLFNKVVKNNGLTGLRYDFLNVEIEVIDKQTIIPMGVMALEESFDKILIENNSRREGLILGFDESMMWDERKQVKDLLLDYPADVDMPEKRELPIKVYNQNKVLGNPTLSNQFKMAKNLIIGLRDGKLKLSEVFDIEKLAFYVALSNLFGGHHGLHIENIRVYYNPVTNKLEPISFDSNSGYKLKGLRGYPIGLHDNAFKEELVKKYELVSSDEFIEGFVNKYIEELNNLALNLSGEFNEAALDLGVLQYNANFIKKKIFPATIVNSTLISYDNKSLEVEIKNLSEFPVVIENLVLANKKSLNENNKRQLIAPKDTIQIKFQLKDSFNNAFVSKKNKEGGFRFPKDLSKIQLSHHLLGSETKKYQDIMAFNSNLDDSQIQKTRLIPHLKDFDFVLIDEDNKTLGFKNGQHELKELLFIPKGYIVNVDEGFQLNLINNASIISYSPINSKGSKENPIRFFSKDSTGGGIFVSSAENSSVISNTFFTNLSAPKLGLWTLSGSVNFNETKVSISNSVFENNRSEDALNIIRSDFSLDSIQFNNTYSDAFDGDFVNGKISNSVFRNSGNDGIDISGSSLEVENITIVNPSDKAISAGEGSTINGRNIEIRGGEIGLVSKDNSRINISNITILDTRLAVSCFQKKTEFGPGFINLKNVKFSGIEVTYLIEPSSDLIIDDKVIQEKTENVIDKMYGSEYGKSSR